MSDSIYELVRRDLLHRESQDIAAYGNPRAPYTGNEALLDAYDSAIDQCVYLRTLIEQMTVGDGRFDKPDRPKLAAVRPRPIKDWPQA